MRIPLYFFNSDKKNKIIFINLHFVEYNIIILGLKFIKKILILVIVIYDIVNVAFRWELRVIPIEI